jgi:hypothetical protein
MCEDGNIIMCEDGNIIMCEDGNIIMCEDGNIIMCEDGNLLCARMDIVLQFTIATRRYRQVNTVSGPGIVDLNLNTVFWRHNFKFSSSLASKASDAAALRSAAPLPART